MAMFSLKTRKARRLRIDDWVSWRVLHRFRGEALSTIWGRRQRPGRLDRKLGEGDAEATRSIVSFRVGSCRLDGGGFDRAVVVKRRFGQAGMSAGALLERFWDWREGDRLKSD